MTSKKNSPAQGTKEDLRELVEPFLSDDLYHGTKQLPDAASLRLDVPGPGGFSVVLQLGTWRKLYRHCKPTMN